ncbi:MAG TPA: serine/threonine-protein kinase [Gemmataceae bacterium]|nr:serine/threonine-protein kinase [Gemmataceae bacterium]
MARQASCPDRGRLQELLAGNLPECEQPALHAHLESCESCQQALEGLAAGRDSWSETARHLSRPEPAPDTALQRLLADLHDAATRTQWRTDQTAHDGQAPAWLAPPARPDHLGRLDRYEVSRVIGRGGMGIVLKAFDPVLNRWVAVKVLAPVLAGNDTARQRFLREARSAAAVSHEHVIAIHAVDEADGLPYLVMEYVAGESLQERLDRGRPLSLEEILRIGTQTASGLAAAHAQGLIHRDIKPANILLSAERGTRNAERGDADASELRTPHSALRTLKITDFGLARAVDDGSLTQSGMVAGTPQYMAPEQARGEALDGRADLFSLGSVLYVLCTGRPPFEAGNTPALLRRVCDDTPRPIHEINPDIPTWLIEIIEQLHAKHPADRFQSAAELAELLGWYLAHVQQPAFGVTPAWDDEPAALGNVPPTARKPGRRWLVPALVLTGLLALLVLLEATGVSRITGRLTAWLTAPRPLGEEAVHTVAHPGRAPELRYRWQMGQTYVYAVQLEAQEEDAVQVHFGNSVYRVRSANADGATLTHVGHLFGLRHPRPDRPLAMRPPFHMGPAFGGMGMPGFPVESALEADASGRVTRAAASPEVPFLSVPLAGLVIEPLGPAGEPSWKVSRATTINEPEDDTSPFALRPPVMPPIPLGPMGMPWTRFGQPAKVSHAADEHTVYTLGKESGTTVVIHKTYDLATTDQAGAKPVLRLTGTGEITFDVKAGLPRSLRFRGTLSRRKGNASYDTPIVLTCRLLEGAERERVLHPPPPKAEPKPAARQGK